MGAPALTFQNGLIVGQDGSEPSQEEAREGLEVEIGTLGIDLAENVFRVHGVDARGKTTVQRQLRRRQVLPFMAELPTCLVGMEACGGAYYWAHEIAKLGHEVKLMSPRFVRPNVKSSMNDARDAEAICEAVARRSMRFA
jgi:transposase